MTRILSKISYSLRNSRDRVRAAVNVKKRNAVFCLAIVFVVVLAIMIRLTPIFRGPTLIKAFDPWIQYYNAKYITEHSLYDYFHWKDTKSWYPDGRERASLRPGLPFTVATIWLILNFFGIPVSIYDVCYYFPAFMGGATVLAMYYLGKECLDRNCGLVAAFFLAFNTGHMQRTMAGFFDNETIGVFATLMVFLFFLKTLKTGKFVHSIIGGIFLGYLSLSWGGYQFVFLILPLVCTILILMNKYNVNVLISYAGIQGTGFLIYGLYFTLNHDTFLSELSFGAVFLFTLILLTFHLIHVKRKRYPRSYNYLLNFLKWAVIPAVIVFAIIIWVNPDASPLGGRLGSVLTPLMRDNLSLVSSVAEHMPSAWGIFYYNTLIPLLLLPLGIFFCFKRLDHKDIFMLTFLLTIFYFTGSMIRIILLFGPAASLVGAYGLVHILKVYGTFVGEKKLSVSRKRKRQLKRTVGNSETFSVYLLVGFLMIAQVFHAVDISINQLSYSQIVAGGEYHDWEDSLTWMKNNLKGTDVVVSWWDYGYWLTPIGNVTTVNDNETSSQKRIGMTGMALMQTNEIYSAEIFRELKADYVLIYFGYLLTGFGGDEGKWPWMLRICNDNYEKYKTDGLEKDNWASDSVFLEGDYINETSGLYEDAWFDSQLVKLMFYGEPTNPSGVNPNTDYLKWYYASQIGGNSGNNINARKDDDGDEWSTHIPTNGAYDLKVFKPVYFSTNGLVKIFQLDYTALDSSFKITNNQVFNTKTAAFDIENTGTRDLSIKSVEINGVNCDFTIGNSNNDKILSRGELDNVWVELETEYNIEDTVNITVSAEADALGGTKYIFSESTDDFEVERADQGVIRINRENSKVEQHGALADISLEVENIGGYPVNLDEFYVNEKSNAYNATSYISGSSVLKPGAKATAFIEGVSGDFNPLILTELKGNLVGVITSHGVNAETLLSYNSENYKLSIINNERTLSPEHLAIGSDNTYNYHIPPDFENTNTFAYTNRTIRIQVKNTGSKPLAIDSVYVAKAEDVRYGGIFNLTTANALDPNNIDTIDQNLILNSGEVNTIVIDPQDIASILSNIELNEEIVIGVSAKGYEFPEPVASDIGVLNAIINEPSITIIEKVDNLTVSYISANEEGEFLLKNTGDKPITLVNIILNETIFPFNGGNVTFINDGDVNLAVQECAFVSVDLHNSNLKINQSTEFNVNITTNTTASTIRTFKAIVDSSLHNISINAADTIVHYTSDEIIINIENDGTQSVTLDSIYVNGTNIALTLDMLELGETFTIGAGNSITITFIYSVGIESSKKYKILARTVEGAEDELIENSVF